MNNVLIYVLLITSIISIVISIVSLALLLSVLKKQKDLFELVQQNMWRSKPSQQGNGKERMVQENNQIVKKQGVIICKKCYAPIPENSTVCSVCKTPLGRR